jgi:hypothetical protein
MKTKFNDILSFATRARARLGCKGENESKSMIKNDNKVDKSG